MTDEYIRKHFGDRAANQNNNWNTFKKERHRTQTDEERRKEREAKYGTYKPGENS